MALAAARQGRYDAFHHAMFAASSLAPAGIAAAAAKAGVVTDGSADATANEALFQRSEEHTSELQSLMRISYAVFCLKKKTTTKKQPPIESNTTYTEHTD